VAGTASFAVGWLSGGKIDDASTNYLGAPAGVWAYDSFLADGDEAGYGDYSDTGATPGNSDSATGNRLRWTPSNI
jgi:hypothetical protein